MPEQLSFADRDDSTQSTIGLHKMSDSQNQRQQYVGRPIRLHLQLPAGREAYAEASQTQKRSPSQEHRALRPSQWHSESWLINTAIEQRGSGQACVHLDQFDVKPAPCEEALLMAT